MRRLNFHFGKSSSLRPLPIKFPSLPPEAFSIEEVDAYVEHILGEKPFDEHELRSKLHQLEDAEA